MTTIIDTDFIKDIIKNKNIADGHLENIGLAIKDVSNRIVNIDASYHSKYFPLLDKLISHSQEVIKLQLQLNNDNKTINLKKDEV